jgi:mono/diheme cytochrome c family protein
MTNEFANQSQPNKTGLPVNKVSTNKRMLVLLSIVFMGSLTLWLPACQKNNLILAGYTPSEEYGMLGARLYEANCSACHGINGRGNGVAAITLDVAPRDFYNEPFRYISSDDGVATDADLVQTIRFGRVNGEMPAAPWFSDDEAKALAEYIREINRLGWIERLTEEFSGDDALDDDELEEISWERVTAMEPYAVPSPSDTFVPDLNIGRELFTQTCASCHGPSGKGDGPEELVDEQGTPIFARDLTRAPIRGGDSPEELFKRVRSGIPGTPMPAQPGYTDDEVWQLVHFTRFLMDRPLLDGWQQSFVQQILNEGDN